MINLNMLISCNLLVMSKFNEVYHEDFQSKVNKIVKNLNLPFFINFYLPLQKLSLYKTQDIDDMGLRSLEFNKKHHNVQVIY